MRKTIKFVICAFMLCSCSKEFLEITPQGELSEEALLTTEEGVEGILVAAYSMLNGQIGRLTDTYNGPPSNWSFGDVCSDDAYKGSSGVSDQEGIHLMEIFQTNAGVKDVSKKWEVLYEGIGRCNAAIRAIRNFGEWDETTRNVRLGEARFLRGHFYFDLKKIYNKYPFVDEQERSPDELKAISNQEFSSDELWAKIEEDFEFAVSVLPESQTEVGRATKSAAYAYLAKTFIYQGKWQETIDACNKVTGHTLLANYGDLWLPANNNNAESVFAIQHSINDGAANIGYNANMGDRLNNLGGPYPRVYGFHTPSENLVRAFKTDSNGLPQLATFNNQGITGNSTVDPRLDYTVGRNGIPFYDAGEYSEAWTRGVAVYGPYAAKKGLAPIADVLTTFPFTNPQNFVLIRYADVILWKAEALVELGDLEQARVLVNQIRERAMTSAVVLNSDGSGPASNYFLDTYNTPWANQSLARDYVRFERRLEFAMEGQRFFDLVRWGLASETLNNYISQEQNLRTYLVGQGFVPGTHEYFPIPQEQIDLSGGTLVQNPGY